LSEVGFVLDDQNAFMRHAYGSSCNLDCLYRQHT
jgi:hypothetical protein